MSKTARNPMGTAGGFSGLRAPSHPHVHIWALRNNATDCKRDAAYDCACGASMVFDDRGCTVGPPTVDIPTIADTPMGTRSIGDTDGEA